MNIITKHIFIEISVRFEEPLQEVELVKDETYEIPSYSADHLDDESGSEGSDIVDLMSDINKQNILGSKSYSDVSNHLPNWAKKTLSSAWTNIGNPANPRRTGLIFKEKVFLSLVMIHCCLRPII